MPLCKWVLLLMGLSSNANLHFALIEHFLGIELVKPQVFGWTAQPDECRKGGISPTKQGHINHTELAELLISSARGFH